MKVKKLKILVADDDYGIIDAMKIVLEDEGYEVITTRDGSEVLNLCLQHPDIIFLDIWMSGLDGNSICRKIKGNNDFKNIPVIIFSANSNTRRIASECGADGFLTKPFEIEDLIKVIQEHTERHIRLQ
jgi:CheY-like chemotaxis protein